MAFPTTPVLDTFTGNNGDDLPVYSASWSAITGTSNLEIQNNSTTGTVSVCGNSWNVQNFGPNSEVYFTVSTKPGTGAVAIGFLRGQATGDLTTIDEYEILVVTQAGTDLIQIRRTDNGVATVLGGNISQEVTDGDGLGLAAFGSNLQAYYRTGGVWSELSTARADTTYILSGRIGLIVNDTTQRLDDFGGGEIYSPPIFNSEWFAFG